MISSPLSFHSVTDLAAEIRAGRLTARALTEDVLARIEALNPRLNAFRVVMAESALAEADARDAVTERARRTGETLPPLHGIPIAIKDENDVAGTTTTLGTGAVHRPRERDGHVAAALRAAGAIIVGKTLMPEFGIWPYTESSSYGITRNPWDPSRTPAGSSGGSAAAVAAGMVPAAIGGDGGGSIRLPAAACGLYGLKPQRGRVSAAPHAALWRSLGTIGPLTRTVADAALIYDVLAHAPADSPDRYRAEPWATPLSESVSTHPRGLRILLAPENPGGGPDADPETLAALERIAAELGQLGHVVTRGSLPRSSHTIPFLLQMAGGVLDERESLDEPTRIERRSRAIMRIARLTRFTDRWAERAVERASAEINAVFDDVDIVLTPTSPAPAEAVGALTGAGLLALAKPAAGAASFTSIWNVAGNPAAAVPSGFSAAGLPLSVQLIAPAHGEPMLIALSAQLERLRPWAALYPPAG